MCLRSFRLTITLGIVVVAGAASAFAQSDTEPPVLVDFDFSPTSVDATSGPADVSCVMTFHDSPAGVEWAVCRWDSASAQSAECVARDPVSGDRQDGSFSCNVTIPQYAEEGIWEPSIRVNDLAGNLGWYTAPDIDALGLPTDLVVGFTPGSPSTIVSHPAPGRRVFGNSVTIRAQLAHGSPSDVSPTLGVRFDYRALPFGSFAAIPARDSNHPNPDTSYPYFIHWDVSDIPGGDYELRAVTHDLAGGPDPSPATITINIDHAGSPDVEEFVNADGLQENRTALDSASENTVASGDHTEASTATELTLPPGSLTFATDTAKLVYLDPATEEEQLEQVEQSVDAFVDLSLLSGQTDLEGGITGDLNISFSDANQDGVVDGTSIREEDLELRRYDPSSGSYLVVPGIVLTEHNMVHADVPLLGKYALVGPLLPKVRFEADKASLTWDTVSTALSYTVYRGSLADLVDGDADGLPDAGYGACVSHLDPDVTDVAFLDLDNPAAAGDGFFYLVGFVATDGERGLGNTSSGLPRLPSAGCP